MKFGKKKEEETKPSVLSVRVHGQQIDIITSVCSLIVKRVPSQDGGIWVGAMRQVVTNRVVEVRRPVDNHHIQIQSVFGPEIEYERVSKYEQVVSEADLYIVEKDAICWKTRIADAIAQQYNMSDYHREFLISNLDNIT
jgi:hypothetical protein